MFHGELHYKWPFSIAMLVISGGYTVYTLTYPHDIPIFPSVQAKMFPRLAQCKERCRAAACGAFVVAGDTVRFYPQKVQKLAVDVGEMKSLDVG